MAATESRRAQGTATSTIGLLGPGVSPHGAGSSSRMFSASLMGPTGATNRARPTTQEIIAEAFGRRLHGLELLSVKKLNALNASAAKLEAHVASRAAAISRTTVATEGGLSLGGGGPGSLASTLRPNGGGAAASRYSVPGDGGVEGESWQPLNTVISVAFPATVYPPGLAAVLQTPPQSQPQPQPQSGPKGPPAAGTAAGTAAGPAAGTGTGTAAAAGSELDIAERGANVVRLLALQDRILHGALGGNPQQLLPSSPSVTSPLGVAPGSRFQTLSAQSDSVGGGGGPGGGLSSAEGRRLDLLDIKHDSKVAAAAIRLFRVSPRSPRTSLDGGGLTTPPNTERSSPQLPELEDSCEALRGEPAAPSRRQVARSHEFSTMAKFIQSLQEGDEASLAQQARDFARFNSIAPTQSQALIPLQPGGAMSRTATSSPVPVALPALSPQRSQVQIQTPDPTSSFNPTPGPGPGAGRSRSQASTYGGGSASLPRRLTIEVPDSPVSAAGAAGAGAGAGAGAAAAGGAVSGRTTARSMAGSMSSSSRVITPGRTMQPELEMWPTGQTRSKDLLDGLMKAVEMFVGAGGSGAPAPPGSGHGHGHGAGHGHGHGSSHGAGHGAVRGASGHPRPDPASPFAAPLAMAAAAANAAAVAAEAHATADQDAGSPVTPYGGVYGSPERYTDRLRKKGALAVRSNPAGYREDVAAGEVALYREVAERCREALARSWRHPRDALIAEELQRRVANLHYCRPFFVAPREALPELPVSPLRPVSACVVSRQNTHFVESAPLESVFLPRAQENESEDMIDTNGVRERQVRKDWHRVVRKDPFRALVGSDDPGAASGTTGLGHALDACLAVIVRHKDTMRAVFTYYSMQSSSINDYCFALGQNEWRAFVHDCGLVNPGDGLGGRSATPPSGAAGSGAAAGAGGGGGGGGNAAPRTSLTMRGGQNPSAPASQHPSAAGPGGRATRGPGAGAGPGAFKAEAKAPVATAATAAAAVAAVRQAAAAAAAASARSSSPPTGKGRGGSKTAGLEGGGGGVPGGGRRTSVRGIVDRLTTVGSVTAAAAAAAAAAAQAAAAAAAQAAAAAAAQAVADAVFAAVNSEPEKRVVDGQVILSRTLLRFEWFESLLRLATMRHVKSGEKCGSIAAALEHMWTREVLPVMLPATVHEPNMWRIVRLYGDPEVNALFIEHMDVISALYGLFCAASKNQRMHMSDWIGLINTCALIGDTTGVTLHAAKLAYTRSLCVVVDELANWGKAVCLTRCGFMEALARLAEELAPPPLEEVAEAMREAGLHGRELRVALEQPWGYYYNELPVELLVARRIAAAEAAAARSTTTGGEDSAVPSVQNSTSRLDMGPGPAPATSTSTSGGAGGTRPSAAMPPSGAASVAHGRPSLAGAAAPAPAPVSTSPPSSWNSLPKLSYRLEALLELMMSRLRDHWECDDNAQLAARLQATAVTLQSAA